MASIGTDREGHAKKSLDSEIPLVPFIDLLLCCIMFLLVTAVWNQLGRVEAQLNGPGQPEIGQPPPDVLPLAVYVTAQGYRVGGAHGDRTEIELTSDGSYDLAALHEHLCARHRIDPNERDVVLTADDGVAYAHLVAAMDAFVANDFPHMTLSDRAP